MTAISNSSGSARASSPGRPAGRDSEVVRAKLLDAARQHFLSNEFKAVSVRQIADTAGVNGAMVNYYFGSKQGLYLAMVERFVGKLESELALLGKDKDLTLADFSTSYCRLLAANPWWPNFMVREVLFSKGEIREAMVKRFSAVFAPRLLELMQKDIANGRFRDDLNPVFGLISLMGMTVFPFLSRTILEQIFGITIDEDMAEKLAAHNNTLFLQGVLARPLGASNTEG